MKFLMRRIIGIAGQQQRFSFGVLEASSAEEALTMARVGNVKWGQSGRMITTSTKNFIEITAEEVKPHEAG
jgi:hypothetical protein